MLGSIGYGIASFVVGAILTFCVALCRPIRQQDTFRSWRWMLVFTIAAGAVPYGVTEAFSYFNGKEMKEAAQNAADAAECVGPVKYWKVLWCKDNKARIVIVSDDVNEWGSKERTILAATLFKDGKGWHIDEYNVVNSYMRGKDHITFPPYW